jgi:hypothetical protein
LQALYPKWDAMTVDQAKEGMWFRVGPRQVVEYNEEDVLDGPILALKTVFLRSKKLL